MAPTAGASAGAERWACFPLERPLTATALVAFTTRPPAPRDRAGEGEAHEVAVEPPDAGAAPRFAGGGGPL